MRKSNLITALLATTCLSLAAPAYAGDVILDYSIPKATIGFAVSHMITQCPDDAGRGFSMDIASGIVPVYGPGETVKVNASGSLFVDRKIELEFHPNGNLKSFNGSSESQGGPAIVAAIKVASFVWSASTGSGLAAAVMAAAATSDLDNKKLVNGPSKWACHKWVKDALSAKEAAEKRLEALRNSVVSTQFTKDLAVEISKTEALIAALEGQLTVEGKPVKWAPSSTSLNYTATAASGDLSVWFVPNPMLNLKKELLEAGYGQLTQFSVSGSSGLKAPPRVVSGEPLKRLAYRRLVTGSVKMAPAAPFEPGTKLDATETALALQRYEATKQSLTPMIPQLGELVEVPFDKSGVFGTRAVSASFTEAGALTAIGYTNKGGAKALENVTDAAIDGLGEIRDAKLNAIKRDIELREQEKKLRDLIEADALMDE